MSGLVALQERYGLSFFDMSYVCGENTKCGKTASEAEALLCFQYSSLIKFIMAKTNKKGN